MESKNYIKDIQMFINEAYSDNEPLQDNQIKSKKVFNDYCNKIKQDLERLEELEEENQELKEKLTLGNSLSRGFIYNSKSLVLTTLENYKDIITKIQKLKKAIEIIMKWRRTQICDLIQNLEDQNIDGFEILNEVVWK